MRKTIDNSKMPKKNWPIRTQRLTLILAIFFVLTSVPHVFASSVWHLFVHSYYAEAVAYTDQVKMVVDNYFETGRSLVQAALTFIAAGWALVAIQKEHSFFVLRNNTIKLMFICATYCAVLSCYAYLLFVSDVTYYLQLVDKSKSIPDVLNSDFTRYFYAQVYGITGSAVCMGLTVIGATWLQPHEGN